MFTNYRLISLLPQFLKILEKLYSDRLDSFLFKYSILSPSQYGFRSNMSTSRALIELVEEITASLDNTKYAIGIFVDLKKAFDTVNHNILAKNYTFMAFVVLHINGLRVTWKTEVNLFTIKIVTQKYSKYVVVCHKDLF